MTPATSEGAEVKARIVAGLRPWGLGPNIRGRRKSLYSEGETLAEACAVALLASWDVSP